MPIYTQKPFCLTFGASTGALPHQPVPNLTAFHAWQLNTPQTEAAEAAARQLKASQPARVSAGNIASTNGLQLAACFASKLSGAESTDTSVLAASVTGDAGGAQHTNVHALDGGSATLLGRAKAAAPAEGAVMGLSIQQQPAPLGSGTPPAAAAAAARRGSRWDHEPCRYSEAYWEHESNREPEAFPPGEFPVFPAASVAYFKVMQMFWAAGGQRSLADSPGAQAVCDILVRLTDGLLTVLQTHILMSALIKVELIEPGWAKMDKEFLQKATAAAEPLLAKCAAAKAAADAEAAAEISVLKKAIRVEFRAKAQACYEEHEKIIRAIADVKAAAAVRAAAFGEVVSGGGKPAAVDNRVSSDYDYAGNMEMAD